MKMKKIADKLYELSFGMVNAYLIEGNDGLVLIDTGLPGNEHIIIKAIEGLGYKSSDLNHILITHLHSDHVSNLNFLKQETGAKTYAHKLEADSIENGVIIRPCVSGKGLMSKVIVNIFIKRQMDKRIVGTNVHRCLEDSEVLAFANNAHVIHTPGHTAGHLSFLLPQDGGILIVGDTLSGAIPPKEPILFENREQWAKSSRRLGSFTFDKAFFSHGKSILKDASSYFFE